ncbi:hypothetical protein CHUAL_010452 [Chamberlinius hualienensis]
MFAEIRYLVKTLEPPPKEQLKAIEKKLETCRNQENNPDSQIYKAKMQERSKDPSEKCVGSFEDQRLTDEELIGLPQSSHHRSE